MVPVSAAWIAQKPPEGEPMVVGPAPCRSELGDSHGCKIWSYDSEVYVIWDPKNVAFWKGNLFLFILCEGNT